MGEERFLALARFDEAFAQSMAMPPCGVDEVGRGCLAGPVVAAAVVVAPGARLTGVDDSKNLSAARRERLVEDIRANAIAIGVGFTGPRLIERTDIRQASLRAMARAVGSALRRAGPCAVLIDGRDLLPGLAGPQQAVIGGDGRSLVVAAASIVAKVARDRFMIALDAEYPAYGFALHKGYGTAVHLEALQRLGPCRWHRRTFAPVAQPSLF